MIRDDQVCVTLFHVWLVFDCWIGPKRRHSRTTRLSVTEDACLSLYPQEPVNTMSLTDGDNNTTHTRPIWNVLIYGFNESTGNTIQDKGKQWLWCYKSEQQMVLYSYFSGQQCFWRQRRACAITCLYTAYMPEEWTAHWNNPKQLVYHHLFGTSGWNDCWSRLLGHPGGGGRKQT